MISAMRAAFIFLPLLLSVNVQSALCSDSSEWLKKIGERRGKKVYQRHTSVAAVRGIQEPGEADPKARNFPAIEKMEAFKIEPSGLEAFIQEGGLKKAPSPAAAPALPEKETAEEIQTGRDVAANVAAQFSLVEQPELLRYVTLVGQAVALESGRPELTFRFAVLESSILNAFAAPGGYIFISRGLLSLLENESQLACVLAHEIAHVEKRHVLKATQKARLAQAAIPGYLRATAKNASYLSQISELSIDLLWKGLSREDELEADRRGYELAALSGYDPASFFKVLSALKARNGAAGDHPELRFLLSTHPKIEDRMEQLKLKFGEAAPSGAKLPDRFRKNVKS